MSVLHCPMLVFRCLWAFFMVQCCFPLCYVRFHWPIPIFLIQCNISIVYYLFSLVQCRFSVANCWFSRFHGRISIISYLFYLVHFQFCVVFKLCIWVKWWKTAWYNSVLREMTEASQRNTWTQPLWKSANLPICISIYFTKCYQVQLLCSFNL